MRRKTLTILGALGCGAALAGPAMAAEGAELDPFEQDLLTYRSFFRYGGFEPQLETVFPKGYLSQWRTSVSVDGTYTDNLDQDGESTDAFYSQSSAGLGWTRRSPRLTGAADYRYSTNLYRSDGADDQDRTHHRAAGTLHWLATRHLDVTAGGHFLQELEQGLSGSSLPGVRSNYANRRDEYGARGQYDWTASRNLSLDGGYRFAYRDYLDEDAEGEDTRSHRADQRLRFRASPKDQLLVAYAYTLEEQADNGERRQIHGADASWAHTRVTFPDNRTSVIRFAYAGRRVLFDDEATPDDDDYYDHTLTLGNEAGLAPNTDFGMFFGVQWIRPDAGDSQWSWTAGANLAHRFSPYTEARLDGSRRLVYVAAEGDAREAWSYSASLEHRFGRYTVGEVSAAQSWEYAPATTRTENTALSQRRSYRGRLESRLTEHLRGHLAGGYLWGDPQENLVAEGQGEYWQVDGSGGLTLAMGQDAFVGADYRVLKRSQDRSADDYLLHRADLFYRRDLTGWLDASLRYSHERRYYEPHVAEDDYRENRIYGKLTATF